MPVNQQRTSSVTALAVISGEQSQTQRTSSVAALGVFSDNPLARLARVTSMQALVVFEDQTLNGPITSSFVTLAVYADNIIERFNQRAWTFNLDGHSFYVLSLGTIGTFVYDVRTDEWAEWQTAGFPNWNMEQGFQLETGEVIAGDNQNPNIWEYRPELDLDDDFRPMTHRVTGAIAMRRRETVNVLGFHLTASVGEVTTTPATMRIRFSDDQGRNFSTVFDEKFVSGDTDQVINLRSLGLAKAPNRVFEIETTGSVQRIDGADLDTDVDS